MSAADLRNGESRHCLKIQRRRSDVAASLWLEMMNFDKPIDDAGLAAARIAILAANASIGASGCQQATYVIPDLGSVAFEAAARELWCRAKPAELRIQQRGSVRDLWSSTLRAPDDIRRHAERTAHVLRSWHAGLRADNAPRGALIRLSHGEETLCEPLEAWWQFLRDYDCPFGARGELTVGRDDCRCYAEVTLSKPSDSTVRFA